MLIYIDGKIVQAIEVVNMKKNKPLKMSPEVIQSLLGGEENTAILHLNSLDRDGRSSLFYSLLLKKTDLLNKLILSGANINQRDKLGWTTLHHAVQRYNVPAVELLLKSGVDVEIKNIYGYTPLWRAVYSCEEKAILLSCYLILELILKTKMILVSVLSS